MVYLQPKVQLDLKMVHIQALTYFMVNIFI